MAQTAALTSASLYVQGPCSAGYYCEGAAASPTPWSSSAFPLNGPCPRGHYCPQGTLYPVPCPTGRTRSNPGEHLACALPTPPGRGPLLLQKPHSSPTEQMRTAQQECRWSGALGLPGVGTSPGNTPGVGCAQSGALPAKCQRRLREARPKPLRDLAPMALTPFRPRWTAVSPAVEGLCFQGLIFQRGDLSLQVASLRRAAGPAQLAHSARAWASAPHLAPVWLAPNAPGTPGPLVPWLSSARRYLPGSGGRGPRHRGPGKPGSPAWDSGWSAQCLTGGASPPHLLDPDPLRSCPTQPPGLLRSSQQGLEPARRKDKALTHPSPWAP